MPTYDEVLNDLRGLAMAARAAERLGMRAVIIVAVKRDDMLTEVILRINKHTASDYEVTEVSFADDGVVEHATQRATGLADTIAGEQHVQVPIDLTSAPTYELRDVLTKQLGLSIRADGHLVHARTRLVE